jgi:RNA polymerase sigma-70 factor, ECF subfamily
MNARTGDKVTQLLIDWGNGDKAALDRLMPLVYDELRRLARHYMKRERAGLTLQTTVLVNEAYLRLVDQRNVHWQNRTHFFAISAQLMRRILIDHARKRHNARRGGDVRKVSLDQVAVVSQDNDAELIALDDALRSLEAMDQRKSKIVELRFFAGLNIEDTAEVIGISPATVQREWSVAKAWLYREIGGEYRDEG